MPNLLKQLKHQMQNRSFVKSYDCIRDQCKGDSHGFVKKPFENPSGQARNMGNKATAHGR